MDQSIVSETPAKVIVTSVVQEGMITPMPPAGYNWHETYDWNYENVPEAQLIDEKVVPGKWDYCGLPVNSPLRSHPKILLTDHMAWYSEESQLQLQKSAAEAIATICTGGLPGSMANPEVLYKLGRFEEWQPSESARWQLKRLKAFPKTP